MTVETRSTSAAKAGHAHDDASTATSDTRPPAPTASNQDEHDAPANSVSDLIQHLKQWSIKADPSAESDVPPSPAILDATEFETEIVNMVNDVYTTLGNAQSEKSYQRALQIEIERRGITCLSEFEIPIQYKGQRIGTRRADLIVQLGDRARYVLELKAVQNLSADHLRQLKYYMVHFHVPLGLLINFPKAQTFPDVELDSEADYFDVDMLQGDIELCDKPVRKARSKVASAPEIHVVRLVQS